MEHYLLLGLTIMLGAGACYLDLRYGKIPNKLTFTAMIAVLCFNTVLGGIAGLLLSLKGFAVGFGLLLIPYLLGGMGAGDVKFLAAIGALMGPLFVFKTMLAGAIAGGVIALVICELRYHVLSGPFNVVSQHFVKVDPVTGKMSFPYGVAISAGMIYAMWPLF